MNELATYAQIHAAEAMLGLDVAESASTAWKFLVPIILGTGALVARATFKQIDANHVGLRTHHGKVLNKHGQPYGFVGPGFNTRIPFVSDFKSIDLRERTTQLKDIPVDFPTSRESCAQKILSLSAIWRVLDAVDENGYHYAYRPFIKVAEGEKGLPGVVASIVEEAISCYAPLIPVNEVNRNTLYEAVFDPSRQELQEYGVVLNGFRQSVYADSQAQRAGDIIAGALSSLRPTDSQN